MRSLKLACALLLATLVLVGGPSVAQAAGACSIYRSWITGDTLTAADLTTSFTTVGQTNMIPTCMDDYSVTVAQMKSAVDPYAGSTESQATTIAGELERLRYAIKQLTGWTEWYAHNGNSFTASRTGMNLAGTWDNAGVTFPGFLTVSVTNTNSAANSLLFDLKVGGSSKFSVDRDGDVATSGAWNGTAIGTQYGGTGGNFSATAQGSIWYFSAAGVVSALAPSDAGKVLQTNGVGANPSWVSTGGNTFATINLTASTNQIVLDSDAGVNTGTLTMAGLTGARVWTLPNINGTFFLAGGGQTVSSGIWNGTAIGTQYGGTGGNFSATAQGNLWYFSAAGTVSALAPGTSGQFLQTQGAAANPTWASVSASPDTMARAFYYDEFGGVEPTANGVRTWTADYVNSGNSPSYTDTSGGVLFLPAGAAAHTQMLAEDSVAGTAIASLFHATLNPTLEMRVKQMGAGAGTRRMGLTVGAFHAGEPTEGIYFRHTLDGNYIGVARASSAESTVDTLIAASSTVGRTLKIVVTGGGTSVEFFVDGVSKGSTSSNIPTSPYLTLGFATSANLTNQLRIDAWRLVQDRVTDF